jgi:carbamoyl-phosphate synthase large subunit
LNVLITCAGRRTSLLRGFQDAARPLGLRVLAVDRDPLAPACALADQAFPVPKVDDPAYVPALLAIAREHGVGLVVPTTDHELPILADRAEGFADAGIRMALSTSGFVRLCRDKWELAQRLRAEDIPVPASWLPGRMASPLPERLFLKPRDGSASLHSYPCRRGDLERMLLLVPRPLIQEFLDGPEISVDALLDFQGRPIHYVPRGRIRILAGESVQGVTLDRPDLEPWIERVLAICSRLGARGPLTIQAFLTPGGPVLTEINPRFGGGFPLARAAGGDYPAWLLALALGQAVPPRLGQFRRGLYMTRYYSELFMESLPW